MKAIVNIIVWFEVSPIRIVYLFAYLLLSLAVAHVIDAQISLAHVLTSTPW